MHGSGSSCRAAIPQVLGRLKALAAWRETEARNKNLPRGRIVKDETLGELSSHPPKTQEDLGRIRGLSAGWKTNDIGARMMAALATAKPLGPDDLPDREPRRPGLTKDAALVSDLLKLLLKIRSKETGVASKLIARTDELEMLAAGVRNGLNILERLALRAIRTRRARPGRRPARLRHREWQAEDDPDDGRGRATKRDFLAIHGLFGLEQPWIFAMRFIAALPIILSVTACATSPVASQPDGSVCRSEALSQFVGQQATRELGHDMMLRVACAGDPLGSARRGCHDGFQRRLG